MTRFEVLQGERRALLGAVFAAGVEATVYPESSHVWAETRAAGDRLAEWDRLHADEWNRVKPWYERRITCEMSTKPRGEGESRIVRKSKFCMR